jgi:hypothetical protein
MSAYVFCLAIPRSPCDFADVDLLVEAFKGSPPTHRQTDRQAGRERERERERKRKIYTGT